MGLKVRLRERVGSNRVIARSGWQGLLLLVLTRVVLLVVVFLLIADLV